MSNFPPQPKNRTQQTQPIYANNGQCYTGSRYTQTISTNETNATVAPQGQEPWWEQGPRDDTVPSWYTDALSKEDERRRRASQVTRPTCSDGITSAGGTTTSTTVPLARAPPLGFDQQSLPSQQSQRFRQYEQSRQSYPLQQSHQTQQTQQTQPYRQLQPSQQSQQFRPYEQSQQDGQSQPSQQSQPYRQSHLTQQSTPSQPLQSTPITRKPVPTNATTSTTPRPGISTAQSRPPPPNNQLTFRRAPTQDFSRVSNKEEDDDAGCLSVRTFTRGVSERFRRVKLALSAARG